MRDLHINVGHYLKSEKNIFVYIKTSPPVYFHLLCKYAPLLTAQFQILSIDTDIDLSVDKTQFEWIQRIKNLVFKTRFNFCLFKSVRRSQITLEN